MVVTETVGVANAVYLILPGTTQDTRVAGAATRDGPGAYHHLVTDEDA